MAIIASYIADYLTVRLRGIAQYVETVLADAKRAGLK